MDEMAGVTTDAASAFPDAVTWGGPEAVTSGSPGGAA